MKKIDSCACAGSCCSRGTGSTQVLSVSDQRDVTIALAGQPNTGKSTLFNAMTGASQHVGNWPGKTVEKKAGNFQHQGMKGVLVDLPGTYSMTAGSVEEQVSRDFILKAHPDVVVVVVDGMQMERSLYMLAEVIMLDVPVVVALNKMDAAEKKGVFVSVEKLSSLLGVPVVGVSGIKKEGIEELLEAAIQASSSQTHIETPSSRPDFNNAFEGDLESVAACIAPFCPEDLPLTWASLKVLEKDKEVYHQVTFAMNLDQQQALDHILSRRSKDAMTGICTRHEWIAGLLAKSVKRKKNDPWLGRFDRLALHPFWGKPIAIGVLILAMVAAYPFAIPLMVPGFSLFMAISPIKGLLLPHLPTWLVVLISNGLLMGISVSCTVMGFIGGIFLALGALENTGYLARLACIFDPLMGRIGLHGKSVIPLLMGSVCNIAGVAGTRTIDTWQQRMITLFMVPAIPCKSLLIVVSFIAGVFFGAKAVIIMLSLLLTMVIVLFLTSFFLQQFVVTGDRAGLIMELPPCQKPHWKSVWIYAYTRMKAFYQHGFWMLVLVSVVTWIGIFFPGTDINSSYLAQFGRRLEPLGAVMGMDWRLCISFLVAFMSKEATLGAMAIIFGAAAAPSGSNLYDIIMNTQIWDMVYKDLGNFLTATEGVSPASALAFLFAIFFSLPCLSTLGMIWAETRSFKWTLGALVFYFSLSVTMGTLVYQGWQVFV